MLWRSWSTPKAALAASFMYQSFVFSDTFNISGKCVQNVDDQERIHEEKIKKWKVDRKKIGSCNLETACYNRTHGSIAQPG